LAAVAAGFCGRKPRPPSTIKKSAINAQPLEKVKLGTSKGFWCKTRHGRVVFAL
jgi:hypothetical protein